MSDPIRVSRDGSPCASPLTPRPVPATSRTLERALPATGRSVIHDLGCGTGRDGPLARAAAARARSTGSCTTATQTCWHAAADVPGPAADGAPVTVEAQHSDITRLRARAISPARP